MKIVFVGSDVQFTTEYFYAKSMRKLGHDVSIIPQYPLGSHQTLTRALATRTGSLRKLFVSQTLGKSIVNKIQSIHPDIVIVFKGELLSDSSIELICSEYSTFLFYPDAYRYQSLLRGRLSWFQGVISQSNNTSLYKEMRAKRIFVIPWACDVSFHRFKSLDKTYDVSFFGSPYLNRYLTLRKLRSVDIFGPYWFLPPGKLHTPVYGEAYITAINQSKINLNIQHPSDIVADAPSWRIFEVAGCGGFILSDELPSIKRYFPDIVTFKDHRDLKEKIGWYLENEIDRVEIAEAMRELCYAKHTFDIRSEQLFSLIH